MKSPFEQSQGLFYYLVSGDAPGDGGQMGCSLAVDRRMNFLRPNARFLITDFFIQRWGEKGCTPNNGFYMLVFSIKIDVNCRFSCAGRCCGRKAGMWRRRHGKFRPLGKETETGVYWMPVACPMVMRVLSAINLL